MKPRILIVDDDPVFRADVQLVLSETFDCSEASTGPEAIVTLRKVEPEAVLLDLMLGGRDEGLDLLQAFLDFDPNLPVLMITEHASVHSAVEAMKRGAHTYVAKTTRTDELTVLLRKALEQRRLRQQTSALREEVNRGFHRIIGESSASQTLRATIDRFSQGSQTVLIRGESGTGKELVARQIHMRGDRHDKPFVAVNCAAIPKDLIENELFGHEAGAFTGATRRKPGKLELAGDGIMFFDEIGELAPEAQGKLLRVLEEREYERVGGIKSLQTNARILAATNQDLEQAMNEGRFRKDLFFRLEMLAIDVPPLRERPEDIPALADHFLHLACEEMKTPVKRLTQEALALCGSYAWPGNVRELRNAVSSAAMVAPGLEIGLEHLPPRIRAGSGATARNEAPPLTWSEMDSRRQQASEAAARDVERRFVEALLARFNGNVSKAAEHAGVDRSNLHRMMKRCGLA